MSKADLLRALGTGSKNGDSLLAGPTFLWPDLYETPEGLVGVGR